MLSHLCSILHNQQFNENDICSFAGYCLHEGISGWGAQRINRELCAKIAERNAYLPEHYRIMNMFKRAVAIQIERYAAIH